MASNTVIESLLENRSPRKNSVPDLRSPGLFAGKPIIGLIMFIVGVLVFGALTYNLLTQGPLLRWDQMLAKTLPAIGLKSPTMVKYIMIATFYIGERVIVVIDILLGLYFFYKKFWRELAMVAIGGAGAALLFRTLSTVIARHRPPTQIWVVVNIPGFPSGHAISSVVCYGLIAYLLFSKMPSNFWKVVLVILTILFIGFIGFSRIFTAGHYLTDILSGYAVGIAWAGLSFTLIELYFKKRRGRDVKEE